MMMRFSLIVCVSMILFSCANRMSDKESIAQIEQMEKKLFATMEAPDDSLANDLMTAYEQFNEDYKENELAPECLFRSANLARSFNQYQRALGYYQSIVDGHPYYQNIIETKFMIAFMYDNDLKDKKKAEELYKSISAEYPNHIFGREAAKRMETLHMTDQEMLDYFKRKNGLSTDSITVQENVISEQ